jgi:hypothetical protein
MYSDREVQIIRLTTLLRLRLQRRCAERLLVTLGYLEGVRDPAMRVIAFLARLGGETPEVAVETLLALERLVHRHHRGARDLYLVLLDEDRLRTGLPPPMLEEIWRIGRLRGYHRLLEMFFFTSRPDRRFEEPRRLPPDIRDIPLGRRKAMARTGRIEVLERLLADNDLSVIRNLLANPRLTEQQVVALAAHRSALPEVLTELAAHRRWAARYPVRKALVFNPATPVSISLPLLKYLLIQDLRELLFHGAASDFLRRAAWDLLGSAPRPAGLSR